MEKIMSILGFIGIAIAFMVFGLIFAGCIRRWGSHGLINGFMSKEQADAVFPDWKSTGKKNTAEDKQEKQ
jgi:hypothetical protein